MKEKKKLLIKEIAIVAVASIAFILTNIHSLNFGDAFYEAATIAAFAAAIIIFFTALITKNAFASFINFFLSTTAFLATVVFAVFTKDGFIFILAFFIPFITAAIGTFAAFTETKKFLKENLKAALLYISIPPIFIWGVMAVKVFLF